MSEWEYRKIALNQLARKTDDVDMLCDAGEEGWELVVILANNVAYFKRQLADQVSELPAHESALAATALDAKQDGRGATARVVHEVKAKYRDPKTNETWSGRGRMATWLKNKQDAGEDIDEYLV